MPLRWPQSLDDHASPWFSGEGSHRNFRKKAAGGQQNRRKQGAARQRQRPDLTSSSFAPKRPSPSGWILASTDPQGLKDTWTHEETGLVALSSIVISRDDGGAGYRLALSLRDGGRCGAAQAFMALADFAMMDAQEIETADRSARVFRLAAAAS